ncbi:peptidoglycan bridge formation glycyltransferase FemA/FemB family protein [Candidatus Saccharibacteria bacterium]|nr:peptidoglycan bridge formation glycyltransferase FemA/FemB family protein [Candidatus Saccharibacteria bacterium]
MSWEEVLKKYPEANFLQSPMYQKMNELLGNKTVVLNFGKDGYGLGIVRDAKRGRYLEIPCGPLIDWKDEKVAKEAVNKITEVAKKNNCVFVRIRPQLTASVENSKLLEDLNFKKSPMHLAAEHTVMIDLDKPEDELLARMRRQTRYEVRRAEKLGIKVTKDNSEEIFKEFHATQVETARRQNFIPPNLKVLMAEREAFGDNITIYTAKTAEDEVIAYGMMIWDGNEGDYYEAASTELNRKLPGAYAIIWRAMKDLKKAGCKRFNLWGIAPAGQPNHRYAGVTTFKTGFGGDVIEYVAAHDLIISKVKYLKDFVVETIRKKKRHL